ncbi:hypothetical protein U1Q18_045833 [Sarracenia purpurea var. burkii]
MDDKEWTSLGLKAKLGRPYQQPNLYQLSQKWQHEQSEHHSHVIQLNAFDRKIHLVVLPDIEAFWKCPNWVLEGSLRFRQQEPRTSPREGSSSPIDSIVGQPGTRSRRFPSTGVPTRQAFSDSLARTSTVRGERKTLQRICFVNTDEPCELLGLDLGESGISGLGCWGKRPGSDLGVRATLASLGSIDPFSSGIEGLWPVPPLLSVRRYRYPCRECRRTRLSPGLSTNSGGLVLLTGHTPLDTGCALQLRAAWLDGWLCRNGSVGVYRPGSSASA